MIAQLLNRQFLLEQMESLTQQLSKDVRQERRGGRETEELEPADYREALDHLTKALEKERALSSGQPGYDVAADRRDGDRSAVLDDFSFFSRDPIVSIVQSAADVEVRLFVTDHFVVERVNVGSIHIAEALEKSEASPFRLRVKPTNELTFGHPPVLTAVFFC
jgi:hypothetical protein